MRRALCLLCDRRRCEGRLSSAPLQPLLIRLRRVALQLAALGGPVASPRAHFLSQMSEIKSDTGPFHFPGPCEDCGRVKLGI